MKFFLIYFLTVFLFCFVFTPEAKAIYDPTIVPNNKVGMHIVDTSDLGDIAKLVNSNGGDWGYVTIVLSDGERNHDRWQLLFDEMRRRHLVPIIRLATHAENGS
ncbi:MAG: hypothetical protein Q7S39_12315, partial [Ignavibacteria bacterium]|nr:hypothetical protein [Ignavibacteria bacterium]